jgi:hypothetical protein
MAERRGNGMDSVIKDREEWERELTIPYAQANFMLHQVSDLGKIYERIGRVLGKMPFKLDEWDVSLEFTSAALSLSGEILSWNVEVTACLKKQTQITH